jgi:hypothetical protein
MKAVRRAAKALKKKDPEQLFSGLCQPAVSCAPKPPQKEKTLTPNEKRVSYTTASRKTISQLSIPTNFIPLLPSCEKLALDFPQIPAGC